MARLSPPTFELYSGVSASTSVAWIPIVFDLHPMDPDPILFPVTLILFVFKYVSQLFGGMHAVSALARSEPP